MTFFIEETQDQARRRLSVAIASAEMRVLPRFYTFRASPGRSLPAEWQYRALAMVRDGDGWTALVPAEPSSLDPLAVFSFSFPAHVDATGFVGWLASHLKETLGVQVMVIGGQRGDHGRWFDYWGVPQPVAARAVNEISRLRGGVT